MCPDVKIDGPDETSCQKIIQKRKGINTSNELSKKFQKIPNNLHKIQAILGIRFFSRIDQASVPH